MHNSPVTEQMIIATSKMASTVGGISALASGAAVKTSWLSVHAGEIATICSICGAAAAVCGLAISFYFQYRRDRREQLTALWDRRRGVRGTRADRKNG